MKKFFAILLSLIMILSLSVPAVAAESNDDTATDDSTVTYTVQTLIAGMGTVTVSTETAAEGDTVTITATPKEGYVLYKLTVVDANDDPIEIKSDNTFTMPASDAFVAANFLMPGTELDTIYFKNTDGWATITADFYNSFKRPVGSVELSIVVGESAICSTAEIPEWATRVSFRNGEDAVTDIMDIPTNGMNQYDPASNAWTEFTATVKDEDGDTPQTGDNSNIGLWLILLIVGTTVIVILSVEQKKSKAMK